MRLTAIDLAYIDHRLDDCSLKYQEIYDEIRDHIISAIEAARSSGDKRNIENVFNEMMKTQFPGYYALEKISLQYEKNYRSKIKKEIWANFKYYLNPQNILLIAVLLAAGFYLPHNKAINIVLSAACLILAVIPVIYAHFKIKQVEPGTEKKSIVKDHIKTRSAFLLLFYFNVLINAVIFSDLGHIISAFPGNCPPGFSMLLISFSIIYGLASMRLCRQELQHVKYY